VTQEDVERAKARIRLYKSGRTIQEVYGPLADRDWYVDDCKLVADWYACNADRIDAERYRWLRAQHHSESTMCVVLKPRDSVKTLSICPSMESLDDYIDKAMEDQVKVDNNATSN
jgi:hypothetical protein